MWTGAAGRRGLGGVPEGAAMGSALGSAVGPREGSGEGSAAEDSPPYWGAMRRGPRDPRDGTRGDALGGPCRGPAASDRDVVGVLVEGTSGGGCDDGSGGVWAGGPEDEEGEREGEMGCEGGEGALDGCLRGSSWSSGGVLFRGESPERLSLEVLSSMGSPGDDCT